MRFHISRRLTTLIASLFLAAFLAGCGLTGEGDAFGGGSDGGGGGGGGGGGVVVVPPVAAPVLVAPLANAEFYAPGVTLSWNPSRNPEDNTLYSIVTGYELQLSRNPNFTTFEEPIIVALPVPPDATMTYYFSASSSAQLGEWYWRVRAVTSDPTRTVTWSSARIFTLTGVELSLAKAYKKDAPNTVFALISSLDDRGLPETGIYTYDDPANAGTEIVVKDGSTVVPNASEVSRYTESYYELIHTTLNATHTDIVVLLDCSASITDPAKTTLADMLASVRDFYNTVSAQPDVFLKVYLVVGSDGSALVKQPINPALLNSPTLEDTVRSYLTTNISKPLWLSIKKGGDELVNLQNNFFTNYVLSQHPEDPTATTRVMEEEWAGALVYFTDGSADNAGGATSTDAKSALGVTDSKAYFILADSGNTSSDTIAQLRSISGDSGLKFSGEGIKFASPPELSATSLTTVSGHDITASVSSISLGAGGTFRQVEGGATLASDSLDRVGAAAYQTMLGNRLVLLGAPEILELAAVVSGSPNANMTFAKQAVAWAAGEGRTLTGLSVLVKSDGGDISALTAELRSSSATVNDFTLDDLSAANVVILHAVDSLLTETEYEELFNWARSGGGLILSGAGSDTAPIGDGAFEFGGEVVSADSLTVMDDLISYSVDEIALASGGSFRVVEGGTRLAVASNGAAGASAFQDPSDNSRRTVLLGSTSVLATVTSAPVNSNGTFLLETADWLTGGTLATSDILVDDGDTSSSVLGGSLTQARAVLDAATSGVISETTGTLDSAALAGKELLIIHGRTSPLTDAEIAAVSDWLFNSSGSLLVSGDSLMTIDGGISLGKLLEGANQSGLVANVVGEVPTVSEAFLEVGDSLLVSAWKYYQFLYCSPLRTGKSNINIETKNYSDVPGSLTFEYDASGFKDVAVSKDTKYKYTCYDRLEAFKSMRWDEDGDGFYGVPGDTSDPDDFDASVSPGVGDPGGTLGDGIDNDRDGNIDEDNYVLTITETSNACYPKDAAGVSPLDPAKTIYIELNFTSPSDFNASFWMDTVYVWTTSTGKIERPAVWHMEGSTPATLNLYPDGYGPSLVSWPSFTVTSIVGTTMSGTYGNYQPATDPPCAFGGNWTLAPVP